MKHNLKRQCRYFLSACIILFSLAGCSEAENIAGLRAQNTLTGSEQVTFVELGSKKCIPCKMMQPVMESIEKGYAGKVKVVFYDVWTEEGKPYAQKYGIQTIPTQVFLDKDGNEFYRHIGFLAENLIVDLLEKQGVTKE